MDENTTDEVNYQLKKVMKKSGKIMHAIVHCDFVFSRKEVLGSGKSYFQCREQNCPAKIHAQYTSKLIAAAGEEELVITW